MYSFDLAHTITTLPNGESLLSLHAENPVGFTDCKALVVRQSLDMLGRPEGHKFETLATPCSLVEHPADAPERTGGFFRTDTADLVFPHRGEALACLDKLFYRKSLLCSYMDALMDDTRLETSQHTIGRHELTLSWTRDELPFRRLIAELAGEPYFLIKPFRGVGRFEDVCAPGWEDIYGTETGDAEGWREGRIELIVYSGFLERIKTLIKQLLARED